jgi:hypothetical protein
MGYLNALRLISDDNVGQDSSVGKVTRYRLDGPGIESTDSGGGAV